MTWNLRVRQTLAKALGSMIDAAIPIVSCVLLLELELTTAAKVVFGAGVVCLLRSLAQKLQWRKEGHEK